VTVAASHRQAWLCETLLRTDNVDNALAVVVQVEQLDAEFPTVFLNRRHHVFGEQIDERPSLILRGNNVVDRCQSPLGVKDRQISVAKHLKRLRTGHFVNQVLPDEELRLARLQRPHGMQIPHLVEQIRFVAHQLLLESGRQFGDG
jgi:hypothetical protein